MVNGTQIGRGRSAKSGTPPDVRREVAERPRSANSGVVAGEKRTARNRNVDFRSGSRKPET
jgi:hypothetical protein